MLRKISGKLNLIGVILAVFALVPAVANAEEISVTDFVSLKNCLAAATENTCKLEGDITTDNAIYLNGKKTIDLNNHNITTKLYIALYKGEDLTIVGNGNVSSTNSTAIILQNNATLTLNGGTYKGADTDGQMVVAITNNNNATSVKFTLGEAATLVQPTGYGIGVFNNNATIDVAGTITTKYFGITTNGMLVPAEGAKTPEFTIRDTAVITSTEAQAIYAAGYANWLFEGGKLTGTEALGIKSGIFNIKGGEFKATGEFKDPAEAYSNGSEPTGAAISITSNSSYYPEVKVTIEDGTFTSANGHAFYEGIGLKADNTPAADATYVKALEIKNGTFTAAEGKDAVKIQADSLESFIVKGTFSSDVADKYIVANENNEKIENADGSVSIVEKAADYSKVDAAIAKANAIDESLYTEESVEALNAAVNAVVRDKKISEQAAVDAMAKAIEDAIKALEVKPSEPVVNPEEPVETPDVPQTSDNVLTYVTSGLLSALGLAVVIKKRFM